VFAKMQSDYHRMYATLANDGHERPLSKYQTQTMYNKWRTRNWLNNG